MNTTNPFTTPFDQALQDHTEVTLKAFKRISRFYTLFHLSFLSLTVCELVIFLLFFSFFTTSSILAFSLASIFLTGFSYFVLLFYFQAKKPEQFIDLRESFLEECARKIPYSKGKQEYHTALAHSIYRLVKLLDKQEYHFYRLPQFFAALTPVLQKFSSWNHWKDIHEMQEKLLFLMVQQQVEQIKIAPSDLEAHASLASTYLQLARLYRDPRKLHPEEPFPWISPEYDSEAMMKKFTRAAEHAIEEFQILDTYAPNTPWTQAQMASVYRDLHLPEKEIACYESILAATPEDPQVLFRLGVLYFEHGKTGKALQIYEVLRERGDPQADVLISHYGSGPL